MKPYYEQNGITIYHADCRDVLSQVGPVDLVLTDPPYGVGGVYGPSYSDARNGYWEWFLPVVERLAALAPLVFTHRVTALRHVTGWDWVGAWTKPYGGGARIGNSAIVPHWEPIFFFGIHALGVKSGYLPDVLRFNPDGNGLAQNGKIGRQRWENSRRVGPSHPKTSRVV